jgi:uncharacterized damage-inducible protein DinB
MPLAQTLLPEFDLEMANTRRLLELVPAADHEWRPHPKSYTLGELAEHLAMLPYWARTTLELSEFDASDPANSAARVRYTEVSKLLEQYDRNVREARTALAGASDAAMGETWTLRSGARTIFTLPRAVVLRSFILSHMIHHRGQLTVYLRLRDVPLPPVYGPTADMR